MINRVKKFLVFPDFYDLEKNRIAVLLYPILLAGLLVTLLFALGMYYAQAINLGTVSTIIAALLIHTIAFGLLYKGYAKQSVILTTIMQWVLVTLTTFYVGGVSGPSFTSYLIVILFAGLLLGNHASIPIAGASVVAGLTTLYVERQGMLPATMIANSPLYILVGQAGNFSLGAIVLLIATRNLTHSLETSRSNEIKLQAVISVGKSASSIRNVDELLSFVTTLIGEKFGFYHVAIFLTDKRKKRVVLQAAHSPGSRISKRDHQIPSRHSCCQKHRRSRHYLQNKYPTQFGYAGTYAKLTVRGPQLIPKLSL